MVAGVTGWLGHQVAGFLLDSGTAEVRAMARPVTDEAKKKRLETLRARGMQTVDGDLSDPTACAAACEGIDVVISAVQGGPDVIIQGQRTLLAAAEAAGVKRMIPSDFSVDISRLDYDDNYNLGLRKTFDDAFVTSRVAQTSVYCGGFLDVVLSPRFPTVDWEKGLVRFWGEGNQPIDSTAISDVAKYTAAAALDGGMTGRALRIAGNVLTGRELCRALQAAYRQEARTGFTGKC